MSKKIRNNALTPRRGDRNYVIGSKEKSIVDFTVPVEDPEGVCALGLEVQKDSV